MLFIHILVSLCGELQIELSCDSLKFIEHFWLLALCHLVKGKCFYCPGEKGQTALVDVQAVTPQLLEEPSRLVLRKTLARVTAHGN